MPWRFHVETTCLLLVHADKDDEAGQQSSVEHAKHVGVDTWTVLSHGTHEDSVGEVVVVHVVVYPGGAHEDYFFHPDEDYFDTIAPVVWPPSRPPLYT